MPQLMYGFIPKSGAFLHAPVCSLLEACPWLRVAILQIFFSKKVDFTNREGKAGLEFLELLSVEEVEKYPKQLCVPWYDGQSDVAFRRLTRCKNLESLQVVIKDDSDIHRIAKPGESLDSCPGWDSIMNIRGCKKTSLVVVAFWQSCTRILRTLRGRVIWHEFKLPTQRRMDIARLEQQGLVSYVDMARLMQATCCQPRLQQSEECTGDSKNSIQCRRSARIAKLGQGE
jgi:hypothetical protein